MYHYFNSNTREILNPVDSIIIRNNKYNNFQIDLNNYLKNFPEIGNFNLIKLKTTYGNSKIGTKNTDIYIFIDADLTPYVKYSSKYFSLYNLFLDSKNVLNFKISIFTSTSMYFSFESTIYNTNNTFSKSSTDFKIINNTLEINDKLWDPLSIITTVYKENNTYSFDIIKL